MKSVVAAALIGAAVALAACNPHTAKPAAETQQQNDRWAYASIAELQAAMTKGEVSSADLVRYYQDRIAKLDQSGPTLRSVLAVNPNALADAEALDTERKQKGVRGPLHGIPILIKDNIDTKDPLPTTAGSLALKDNFRSVDAPVVARLRAAGAVILGKTNLSEWANIRDDDSTSGWSAVGGLVRNPHALDRSACGSSSGSGAAVAAGLAPAALGTETDGSVVCPSSINGIVGVKPTVGLAPRTGIVPISASQDTPGPMTRTVADAALVLSVIAGSDPADSATMEADAKRSDYVAALSGGTLQGKRLGVILKGGPASQPQLDALFESVQAKLKSAGAILVPIEQNPPLEQIGPAELFVLLTELKAGMADYLKVAPEKVPYRTLADLIAFNKQEAAREQIFFRQALFEKAEATKGLADPAYLRAREESRRLARATLDNWLKTNKLDALIAPTIGPAWISDVVNGDSYVGGDSTLAAVAGYPHVTTPMGLVQGLPVGLSFIGPAWSEGHLLALAAASESVLGGAPRPTFAGTISEVATVAPGLAPQR